MFDLINFESRHLFAQFKQALNRTLELERKDRKELEDKALQLITSAKTKWEDSSNHKFAALTLQVEQKTEKIFELTKTNVMLNEQLQHMSQINDNQKASV